MEYPQEQPVYVLPQATKRALLPKIVSLVVLGGIFYLGILLNVALLDLTPREQTQVKTISLIVLLVIVTAGTFLSIHRSRTKYKFYQDRIIFNKKNILYTEIGDTTAKHSLLDKLFKTYSINLGSNFYIRNISQQIALQDYLQKLIAYAKRRM